MLRFRLCFETGMYRNLQLGHLKLPMSLRQKDARDALYTFIVGSNVDPLDMTELGRIYHTLVDSLLRVNIPAHVQMGCPTDIVLALSTITSDGNFYPDPNVLTRSCSQFQFCFRSIHLTIARLLNERRSNYAPLGCPLDDNKNLDDKPSAEASGAAPGTLQWIYDEEIEAEHVRGMVNASHSYSQVNFTESMLPAVDMPKDFNNQGLDADDGSEPLDLIEEEGVEEPLNIMDDKDQILRSVVSMIFMKDL